MKCISKTKSGPIQHKVQRSPLATKVMNHPVAPRAEFTTYFKAAARRATKLHQLCLCCRAVCWVGRSLGRSARIKERFRKMAWYGSDWQLLRRRCSTHRKQKASLPSHLANGDCVLFVQLNNAAAGASLVRTQRRKCDRPAGRRFSPALNATTNGFSKSQIDRPVGRPRVALCNRKLYANHLAMLARRTT
jgi:hypothetical protein